MQQLVNFMCASFVGCTGPQQAAVAIIRLSGPEAVPIAAAVFRSGGSSGGNGDGTGTEWQPTSHRMYYGTAVGPDGSVLDEVIFCTR